MYSKAMLIRLSEKTKEGSISWRVMTVSLNTKRYEAVSNLLRLNIISNCLDGEVSKHYRHTFEIEEGDKTLLKDFNEWRKDGVNEESADMMQALISLIEEQETRRREAEKEKREETISHILKRIR